MVQELVASDSASVVYRHLDLETQGFLEPSKLIRIGTCLLFR